MAKIDDILKSGTTRGVVIGLGVAAAAPLALAAASTYGRPAARAAIKAGLVLYDKGQETVAEMGEVFEDLVAEARAEIDESAHRPEAAEPAADEPAAPETDTTGRPDDR